MYIYITFWIKCYDENMQRATRAYEEEVSSLGSNHTEKNKIWMQCFPPNTYSYLVEIFATEDKSGKAVS